MRLYAGERDPETGVGRVWALQQPPRPEITDVVEILAALRSFSGVPASDDEDAARRRAEVLARKEELIRQLEAAEHAPPPVELVAPEDSFAGFGWGGEPGADALARSVLRAELGEDPPSAVFTRFRADVVDSLYDRWSFRLPAERVWSWIEANRSLVEHELFEKLPEASLEHDDGLALAVTSDSTVPGKGELSDAAASEVVRACEEAWASIREHHAELPGAVMVLGSGVERGRLVKLGHWWAGRWVADGQPRGEVLLAGEALHLKPEEVFEVLLHEAAHGLNAARGVRDTSRGGRYHNARFGAAAREVGLVVSAMPPYGLAKTALSAEAKERYATSIERLGEVMRIARQIERGARTGVEGGGATGGGEADRDEGSDRSRGRALAQCGCGRKIRIAPGVLAAGPIVCGLCEAEFTTSVARHEARVVDGANVVDRSFLDRRQAALSAGAERETVAQSSTMAAERAFSESDLTAAAAWYERFGTHEEQPMPAADDREVARREYLARALLRADGTIRGPGVEIAGRELAVGDRVIAASDVPGVGLPAATLGTVEHVDDEIRSVDIDFATWGRLRVGVEDTLGRLLRHDYTELPPACEAAEPLGLGLDEPRGAGA